MLFLIWFWRMCFHVLQFALLLLVCVLAVHLYCSHRDDFHFQIPHLRPAEYKRSRLSRNRRTVNRPYGGVLSGTAVRERLANSFSIFGFDNPKVANLLTCLCNPTGSSVLSWLKSRRLSRRCWNYRRPKTRLPQSNSETEVIHSSVNKGRYFCRWWWSMA